MDGKIFNELTKNYNKIRTDWVILYQKIIRYNATTLPEVKQKTAGELKVAIASFWENAKVVFDQIDKGVNSVAKEYEFAVGNEIKKSFKVQLDFLMAKKTEKDNITKNIQATGLVKV